MKLDAVLKEISDGNPVAIVAIYEKDEETFTSRVYGRICEDCVTDVLADIVKQRNDEIQRHYDEVKDQLPF